jgi:hypothetical protein
MSITTPARQPAGVRAGGQFRATALAESPVDLPVPDAPVVEAVNGLVPRMNAAGRWFLADESTGKAILSDANRRRGSHATIEAALQWAERTYPLVARVRATLDRKHPALVPTCGDCEVDMVQEVDDERARATPVWVCPVCSSPSR